MVDNGMEQGMRQGYDQLEELLGRAWSERSRRSTPAGRE